MLKVNPHLEYPPEEERFVRGNDASPAVVAIILNCDADKIPPEIENLVRAGIESGAALSGTVQTENIGFEKIVCNVVANPNIRYMIVGGPESEGHLTGEALKSLILHGVDKKMRIDDPKVYNEKVSIMNGPEEQTGNPKSMRYNTTFSRLLKLFFNMSEMQRLELLKYARSIVDERTLPRNLCLIPVNCRLERRDYDGLILDINSCGAYIDTNKPFPIGQKTNLFFFSPFSQKNVKLNGKIIWSSDHGIGVRFSEWSRMRYIW